MGSFHFVRFCCLPGWGVCSHFNVILTYGANGLIGLGWAGMGEVYWHVPGQCQLGWHGGGSGWRELARAGLGWRGLGRHRLDK